MTVGLFDEIKNSLENKKIVQSTKYYFKAPNDYNAKEIKSLRLELKLTQKLFAELMGVSLRTVEAWEAGVNSPNGPSLRLMQIFSESPLLAETYLVREMLDEKLLIASK